MDSEITQSEQWLRFIAWIEDNIRRVIAGAAVVVLVGTVIAFLFWRGAERQRAASEALSLLLAQPDEPGSAALLAVANDHSGTQAGYRALLLAAGALYVEGRFDEARSQFQRFLAGSPGSPLTPQARFGIAACREALGETESAIADYETIVGSPAGGNVVPQARFALGNLYLQQGQTELAREQYQKLADSQGTSLAAEARARLADLPAPASSATPGEAPFQLSSPTPEAP